MSKHPGGRPKKFTKKKVKELITKLNEYIDKKDIPKVEEFCFYNDISKDRIYHIPEFSYALARLKLKQCFVLQENALFRKTDVRFTKFMLINNHKWADKQEMQIDSKNKINVKVEFVDPDFQSTKQK